MLQEFFVSSSQEAVLLRDAIACEGGNFLARWQGSVSIDGWGSGFVLGLGTKLLVVGEGEDAEILGAVLGSKAGNAGLRGASVLPSRFFTVTGLATSLDLQNLKLVGGIAPSVAGNTFAAMGGAIAVSEGASATIQKSAFINNYAYDSGGAVAIMGVRTDVTITNTTFSGNSAARMNGGALYIDLGASLIMTSCLVSNSIAQRDGGALAAMRGSTVLVKSTTFSENIARSGEGGGIHAVDGVMLSLIESSIERNTASTIAGGIRVAAGSNASLTDCTLIDNSVVSGEGPSASISDSRADFLSVALADSSGSDSRFAVHLQVESIFLCELCTFRGWAGKQVSLRRKGALCCIVSVT
jgi:predicted outer membrane repeat protein